MLFMTENFTSIVKTASFEKAKFCHTPCRSKMPLNIAQPIEIVKMALGEKIVCKMKNNRQLIGKLHVTINF